MLLDLETIAGANAVSPGAPLGCKLFVEDLFADLERFAAEPAREEGDLGSKFCTPSSGSPRCQRAPMPALVAVFSLVAEHNLVLAMGRSSLDEVLLLMPVAKRQGVENVLVTHVLGGLLLSPSISFGASRSQTASYRHPARHTRGGPPPWPRAAPCPREIACPCSSTWHHRRSSRCLGR